MAEETLAQEIEQAVIDLETEVAPVVNEQTEEVKSGDETSEEVAAGGSERDSAGDGASERGSESTGDESGEAGSGEAGSGEEEEDGGAVHVEDATGGGGSVDVGAGGADSGVASEGSESPKAFDTDLLAHAVSLGLSYTEAKEFPDNDSLVRFVNRLESHLATPEAAAKEPVEVADPFSDFPKLDPEVHDPSVIAMFDKLTGIAKAQYGELQTYKERQSYGEEAAGTANQRAVEEFFDGRIASLGEDFEEVLGKGSSGALDKGSSQYAKRDAIAQHMSTMLSGYAAQGRQAPPDDEVFASSAKFVLRNEYQAIYDKKLSGELGDRAGQHMQRASGKKASSVISAADETAQLLNERFGA